jgi:hypothetical protein
MSISVFLVLMRFGFWTGEVEQRWRCGLLWEGAAVNTTLNVR